MSTTQASVRIQAPAGAWETLGVDRARGVVPENIQLTSTDQGPDTASFDLRRDPGVPWPDLGALSPVEVRIGGVLVWDGFVSQTPTRDGAEDVVSVQARGWQYYLDEDTYTHTYVDADLTGWQDMRSWPTTDLGIFNAQWQVDAGTVPQITWPASSGAAPSGWDNLGGVYKDFGGYVKSLRIVWDGTGDGNGFLAYFANRTPVGVGAMGGGGIYFDDSGQFAVGSVTPFTGKVSTITFLRPMRFVRLCYYRNASFTFPADIWMRFTSITAIGTNTKGDIWYGDGSTYASTLKASDVVADAVATAAPQVAADRSLIQPSSFVIPSFTFTEGRTPREVIQGVNAFHDWQIGVAVGKRPMFRPRPTLPRYQIGGWGGAEYSDASAGDASEIYDRCVVQGQDTAGRQLQVDAAPASAAYYGSTAVASTATALNPSFTTNTSDWENDATGTSTLSRDTSVSHSGPASGKWDFPGPSSGWEQWIRAHLNCPGGWTQGLYYYLTVWVKGSGPGLGPALGIWDASRGVEVVRHGYPLDGTNWTQCVIPFATSCATGATDLHMFAGAQVGGAFSLWFDDLTITQARPTATSRWGRRRTKLLQVSNPINEVTAQRIGETFLAGHQQTPLKGDVSAAYGGIRDMDSRAVHPSLLLLETGGVLQLSDRVDPDTGAVGRLGQIASVSYDHSNETAQISLDNQRNRIESFLERLAVVTGAALQR